jgi:hypothetical protein
MMCWRGSPPTTPSNVNPSASISEEVFERGARAFRRIDDAAREPIQQRARRQVDHHNLIRLLQHPVWNGLAHADAGALPDLVVQALEVSN